MIRVCPCGYPLVRKPKERRQAFEDREYCNTKCRTRYHKPAPKTKAFGIQVPQSKEQIRVGPGMLNYLYSRPI